jgi:hypothetical protein
MVSWHKILLVKGTRILSSYANYLLPFTIFD